MNDWTYYNKRRARERQMVSFEKVEKIRDKLKLKAKDVAVLLGVGTAQYTNYKRDYALPLTRFVAARDALLVQAEEEARTRRELIISLFS